jgi:hypothetical protein
MAAIHRPSAAPFRSSSSSNKTLLMPRTDPHETTMAFGRRAAPKLLHVLDEPETAVAEKMEALKHLIGMASSQEDKASVVLAGGTETSARLARAHSDDGVRALAVMLLGQLCQLSTARSRLEVGTTRGAVSTMLSMATHENAACRHAAADALSTLANFPESRRSIIFADEHPEEYDGVELPGAMRRLVESIPSNVRIVHAALNLAADYDACMMLLDAGIVPVMETLLGSDLDSAPEAFAGAIDAGARARGGNAPHSLRPPAPLPRASSSSIAAPLDTASLLVCALQLFGRLCNVDGGVDKAVAGGAVSKALVFLQGDFSMAQRAAAASLLMPLLNNAEGVPLVVGTDFELLGGVAADVADIEMSSSDPLVRANAARVLECLLVVASGTAEDRGRGVAEGFGVFEKQWSVISAVLDADEDRILTTEDACRIFGPQVAVPALAAVCDPSVDEGVRRDASIILAKCSMPSAGPPPVTSGSIATGCSVRHALGRHEGTQDHWSESWFHHTGYRGLAALKDVAGSDRAFLKGIHLACEGEDNGILMSLSEALCCLASESETILSAVKQGLDADPALKEAFFGRAFDVNPRLRDLFL